jgi:hypothetical protein
VRRSIIESAAKCREFLMRLGGLITDYCGGEVIDARSDDPDRRGHPLGWRVAIVWNNSVPDDGGIYADLDRSHPLDEWIRASAFLAESKRRKPAANLVTPECALSVKRIQP